MDQEAIGDRPSTNGHGDPDAARRATQGDAPAEGAADGGRSLAGWLLGLAGDLLKAPARAASIATTAVTTRIPAANLDDRDPDYIRESLPRLWLLASLYFRGEVRGLGNIPEEGPVLLVGNHSGGNVTPDTHVFTLAFSAYFGVERRFHQLAHNLVL